MSSQIVTDKAPEAIGLYSQGTIFCNLVFVSGQIPLHPVEKTMPDGKAQTRQALKNIQAILETFGTELNSVLKTTIFLTNMQDFSAVNTVYGDFFHAPYPARSCVVVKELPRGARVEIEAIAHKKEQ